VMPWLQGQGGDWTVPAALDSGAGCSFRAAARCSRHIVRKHDDCHQGASNALFVAGGRGRQHAAIRGGGSSGDLMSTVRLISDQEAETIPAVREVFDDIRKTRKSDFINNFWRGLANDPVRLKAIWQQ